MAVSIPTLTPDTTRAASNPGTEGQRRKITPDATLTDTAITAIRRRPTQSDTCPARNRLAITPTA